MIFLLFKFHSMFIQDAQFIVNASLIICVLSGLIISILIRWLYIFVVFFFPFIPVGILYYYEQMNGKEAVFRVLSYDNHFTYPFLYFSLLELFIIWVPLLGWIFRKGYELRPNKSLQNGACDKDRAP